MQILSILKRNKMKYKIFDMTMLRDVPQLRRSKRTRKSKDFGNDFFFYLVEGSRESVFRCVPYCYNVELDPRTYKEAMSSPNASFWKEAIDDEITSITEMELECLPIYPQGANLLAVNGCLKLRKTLMVQFLSLRQCL